MSCTCSKHAVVITYQKWSQQRHPVNWAQGHWTDQTEQLLSHKLLKTLTESLIEKCQSTQCITACRKHGCVAPDQSEYPCWTLSTTYKRICEDQNWTLEKLKKVVWSEELWFLLSHLDTLVPMHHVPEEEMEKEVKVAEAVWGSGQWGSGKPWLLTFMWMSLWHKGVKLDLERAAMSANLHSSQAEATSANLLY